MPEKVLSATNPTALPSIEGPSTPGTYFLRVWLEDQVGFSGPAAVTPIPHDTVPPAAPQGLQVAAPDTPRSADGFDLRWHDLTDAGSPIDAAHYQVIDGAGEVVVPTQTVSGDNVESVPNLEAPSQAGSDQLRLWLSDAEGNAGAPVIAPLSYDCARSPVSGGAQLATDLSGQPAQTVQQGQGATLSGSLRDASLGPVIGAPLCVFSQVEDDPRRDFLGLAFTDAAGSYRFAIAAGPSRTLSALYRDGHRDLRSSAELRTQVKPALRARRAVIRNGQVAHLEGEIPGPRNDDVVIVLQVKQGDGWLAFRRYRTRDGGHFEADYLFRRTTHPTTYEMRAQVRESGGYPYLEGDSNPLFLKVVPDKHRVRKHCRAGRRLVRRRGKATCGRKLGHLTEHNHHRRSGLT